MGYLYLGTVMGDLKRLVEETNSLSVINEFYDSVCTLEESEINELEAYILEKLVNRGRTISDIIPKKKNPPILGAGGKISRSGVNSRVDDAKFNLRKLKDHGKRLAKMPLDNIHGFANAMIKKDDDTSGVVGRMKDFFKKARQKKVDGEQAKTKYDLNDPRPSQSARYITQYPEPEKGLKKAPKPGIPIDNIPGVKKRGKV